MSNSEIIDKSELQGLENGCEVEVGQIKHLWYLRSSDDMTESGCCGDSYLNPGDISVKKGFVKLEFLPDQALYTESTRTEESGTVWDQRIEIKRNGLSAATLAEVCRLTDSHLVFIADFFNGQRRKLGSSKTPFLFGGQNEVGRKRKDLINQNLSFNSISPCPACLLDSTFQVPTLSSGVPIAFMRIARGSACNPVSISTYPLSQRIDGSVIDSTTSGSQVQLEFTFGSVADPFYIASIGPDGDASDLADWTYIGGKRTSTQFQAELVDQIITNLAIGFTFNPQVMSLKTSINTMPVSLRVIEYGIASAAYASTFTLGDANSLIAQTTGGSFAALYSSKTDCLVTVDFGDGTLLSRQVTRGVQETFFHSYAASGTYEVKLYTEGASMDMFTSPGQRIERITTASPNNLLRNLGLNQNNLGPDFTLRGFPHVQTLAAATAGIEKIDFGRSPDLRDITLDNNAINVDVDFSQHPDLGQVFLQNNQIPKITLGGSKENLTILDVGNNQLNQQSLENLVDELYTFRNKTSAIVTFNSNPGLPLSQSTLDKINGTGAYAGDGLESDHGWSFFMVP